jgi:putative membrane protein
MASEPGPRRGAILFDDAPRPAPDPATAPPVPEAEPVPEARGRAMQTAALLAAPRRGSLAGWFWGALLALLGFAASLALWEFVAGLLATRPWAGLVALGLSAVFTAVCLAVVLRELVALSRLERIDAIRQEAAAVADRAGARALLMRLTRLYAGRPDTRWGRKAIEARENEAFDPDDLLALANRELLAPLDAAATREVEAAARQVALVTAVVPLAFADVAAAAAANLRMIRRIALIYGGRSGVLGSWRLARAVLAHLAATGAVAVGDDLIHSVAGGGVLARVSRRFGEGIVNGALTARVGLAAMEVCRPLPFPPGVRPRTTGVVQRALTGLFGRKE